MKVLALVFTMTFFTSLWAHEDLRTANHVDISRYIGKWFAIESLPQFFTRKCSGQTANYQIIDESTISVVNTCLKGKGTTKITGKAVVKNPRTNAELEVTFNNFFTRLFRVKGDYTIIELDPDYEYVMVGSKDRKSLWIMSRTTEIPDKVLEEYKAIAAEEGFDVSKLERSKF